MPAREDLGARVRVPRQRRARRADHAVARREQRVDGRLRLAVDSRRPPTTIPVRPRRAARRSVGAAGRRAPRGSGAGRRAAGRRRGGTPVGSTPTENAVERAASGTSISESLPGIPPSAPNSSPANSTSSAAMPSRRSSRSTARAESALSVSPISTCLASLVIFGAARPTSRAADSASAATSGSPEMPAAGEALGHGREQGVDLRLGRVGPLGERDQVDLPAVEPLTRRCAPRVPCPRAARR